MPALLTETISRAAGAVRRSKRFISASGGVAAVEFAMVLPVMVLMYLGMTEMTFGVNTDPAIPHLGRPHRPRDERQLDRDGHDLRGLGLGDVAL